MLTPTQHLGNFQQPLLIFGGPYSNYQATKALLKEADKLNIPAKRIICTGDTVAYAAEPEATCQLIKDAGIHVLMGNCEESLATDSLDCGCGFSDDMLCSIMSVGWYNHAKQQISKAHKQWMGTLPRLFTFNLNGISACVVHGGLHRINEFIFASNNQSAKIQQWQQARTDLMIGGHCGLPFGQPLNNGSAQGLWLNAGVIGLPANDATPDGWYMLLTPQKQGVRASWHRLQYDYHTCQQHMQQAGLHDYAASIENGLWPSMDVLPEYERRQQGNYLKLDDIHYEH